MMVVKEVPKPKFSLEGLELSSSRRKKLTNATKVINKSTMLNEGHSHNSPRCPPTTGRARNPSGVPLVVSYQSPSGCDANPSDAHFRTEEMSKSRTVVSVAIAAVQISQSVGTCQGTDTLQHNELIVARGRKKNR